MSFILRDFLTPARMMYNVRVGLYRQFDRAFSKTTIDGIEVYNNKLTLWNGSVTTNPTTKRFLNKVGFEFAKLKTQNYSGVSSVFMTFDSKKYSYTPLEKEEIKTKIDNHFNVGDKFKLKITYGADFLRYFKDHSSILNDINYLVNKLDSDSKKYYAAMTILTEETENYDMEEVYQVQRLPSRVPVISVIPENEDFETLALLDDGTFFKRNKISSVLYKTHQTAFEGKLVDEISCIYEYEVIAVPENTNNQLINYIHDISENMRIASINMNINNRSAKTNNSYYYTYTNNSLIKQEILSWQDYDTSIFYNNYLKVDAVKAMSKKEFVNVLSKTLKIDYTKKKVPWWKKLLGIIIIIASVWFGFTTFGISGLGGAGGWAMAGQLATTLMVLNLSLGFGLMISVTVLGKESMGSLARMIGGVMQITGLLSSILGVYSFMSNAMNTAVKMGFRQVMQGVSAFNGLFNFFNNGSNEQINANDTETQNKDIITASDIESYRQVLMEPDALQKTDLIVQNNLGGTKTEIVKMNQAV